MVKKYKDDKLGVRTGKDFTKMQLRVIGLLSEGKFTLNNVSEQTNVSLPTLHRWKNNPQFMDAIIDRARANLKHFLPQLYTKLAKQALGGDFQHMKLMLEHLERLEELKDKCSKSAITFTWEAPSC